jgi:hypothetical protein
VLVHGRRFNHRSCWRVEFATRRLDIRSVAKNDRTRDS